MITFSAIRVALQRLIDRAFYRGRLSFEQILREMGERLATTLVFADLATLLTEYIPTRLRVVRAALYTDSAVENIFAARPSSALSLRRDGPVASWLASQGRPLIVSQIRRDEADLDSELQPLIERDIEICLPLRRGGNLIGIYVLGKKLSGDLYDDQEVETLEIRFEESSNEYVNPRSAASLR